MKCFKKLLKYNLIILYYVFMFYTNTNNNNNNNIFEILQFGAIWCNVL